MENFVNNEKFKGQLEHDLDKIIDQKRFVYEQIKKLEVNFLLNNSHIYLKKEESILSYNITFFENYLRMLETQDNKNISDMKLEEFMNHANQRNSLMPMNNNINKKQKSKKNFDVIEENIKAFDESLKNKSEKLEKLKNPVEKRTSKNKKIAPNVYVNDNYPNVENEDEDFLDEQEQEENQEQVQEQEQEEEFKIINFKEENYFKDLIKRNFEN
jgi:hypothetical protein